MALAGMLSRPSSAQGAYSISPIQGYYPEAAIPAVYSRPGSATRDYDRPATPRQTSSNFTAASKPNSPTRIYGGNYTVSKPEEPEKSDLNIAYSFPRPPDQVSLPRTDASDQAASPRINTPVPSNYTDKSTLKNRLRRALSLSSASQFDAPPRRDIYEHQNKSNDNVSLASTASSASMMLRKMGHGLSKKTRRSFSGIFSGSKKKNKEGFDMIAPAVTYANVEVQPEPITKTEAAANVDGQGAVGFPRLSQEVNRRSSVHLSRPLPQSFPTKPTSSYTGKGILKKQTEFDISFPSDFEHRSTIKFSPRITIHETYTHSEYDRRGEVATCNRLTPLLAQRIKEELNAYKMDEMAVAEDSRIYTHFFT